MNFGEALEHIKKGGSATRTPWNEGAKIVMFKEVDQYMVGWCSDEHPMQVYHPTASDMLAEDWEVL